MKHTFLYLPQWKENFKANVTFSLAFDAKKIKNKKVICLRTSAEIVKSIFRDGTQRENSIKFVNKLPVVLSPSL